MDTQSALATHLLASDTDIPSSVLIEIVTNLSFAEFYEIYAQAKPDEPVALDNAELVAFLLSGGDDGKKLVIASFSANYLAQEAITAETAIKLANVSPAHKIALLSNVRLNWYWLSQKNGPIQTQLLGATLLSAEDEAKLALLRNPRMDRSFVADVIRGKGEFHAIPVRERFGYGLVAIKAKEIKSEPYPGKDSPDSNELHFNKPERALLATTRELLADSTVEIGPFNLEYITRLYGQTWLSIDDDDWLSEDQKLQAEKISDWSARYKSKNRMALINFIKWISDWSRDEPEIPKVSGKDRTGFDFLEKYAKGTLASMLSYLAFSQLGGEEITEGMASRNWCVRAGAFAAKYASLAREDVFDVKHARVKAEKSASKFLTQYATDAYALVRGLALVRAFWKRCANEGTILDIALSSVLGKHNIQINDETRRYLAGHVIEMVYPEYDEGSFAADKREESAEEKLSSGIKRLEHKMDVTSRLLFLCIAFGCLFRGWAGWQASSPVFDC